MAFPRHRNGTLDFEAFEALDTDEEREAALDIRDNYPEDREEFIAYILARKARHEAEEEDARIGMERAENEIAEAENKIKKAENEIAETENKIEELENTIFNLEEENKQLIYQRDRIVDQFVADVKRELRNPKVEPVRPTRRNQPKPSRCTIL